MDSQTLTDLYTYHPTTPETAPLYARLSTVFEGARIHLSMRLNEIGQLFDAGALQRLEDKDYASVSMALLKVAAVVEECCPESEDKDAAHLQLRLGRMWANKALLAHQANRSAAREMALVATKLEEAQMLANSAIACHTPQRLTEAG